MKFCQKCGKEIRDEAVICPNCGCAVEKVEPKETNRLARNALGLALLCPIAGFILSIVGFAKYKEQKYINMCIGALFLSILIPVLITLLLLS